MDLQKQKKINCHRQLSLSIKLVKLKREELTTCRIRRFPRKPEIDIASMRLALEKAEEVTTRACKEGCGGREQRNSQPGAQTALRPAWKCACADCRGEGRGGGA